MSKSANCTHWLILIGLTVGLAAAASAHAAQPKKLDLDAEAKQTAQEDADISKMSREERGKLQRIFTGKFSALSDDSDKLSPDVLGTFDTSGHTYLVKVGDGKKALVETLKRSNGKTLKFSGELRVKDQDGVAKYLIVSSILESTATPPPVGHRKLGGS